MPEIHRRIYPGRDHPMSSHFRKPHSATLTRISLMLTLTAGRRFAAFKVTLLRVFHTGDHPAHDDLVTRRARWKLHSKPDFHQLTVHRRMNRPCPVA